mmetsp:Transcript_3812/g.8256  ORF Transcript_3812/g.8256 Transcript_3812/m.8256 type:complete len:220 (+) Transcript_3812:199-858(+)
MVENHEGLFFGLRAVGESSDDDKEPTNDITAPDSNHYCSGLSTGTSGESSSSPPERKDQRNRSDLASSAVIEHPQKQKLQKEDSCRDLEASGMKETIGDSSCDRLSLVSVEDIPIKKQSTPDIEVGRVNISPVPPTTLLKRAKNEDLYNILDYFQASVDAMPETFDKTEKKHSGSYHLDKKPSNEAGENSRKVAADHQGCARYSKQGKRICKGDQTDNR